VAGALGVSVLYSVATWAQSMPHDESEERFFDCGTLALYHLLPIEGRSPELASIGSRLPPMASTGYSMKEVRDAASACGLPLVGLRLKDPARELNRPMIVFFRQGHFAVVRPVGHTGNLVQVLEGVNGSEIIDRDVLFHLPNWTGLALAPRDQSASVWVGATLASLVGTGLVFWLYPRLKIRKRDQPAAVGLASQVRTSASVPGPGYSRP